MSQKVKFFLWAVLSVALVVGASVLYTMLIDTHEPEIAPIAATPPITSNSVENGDREEAVAAPDFEMYDFDMNSVNLSDFFGKPIVISFWTSWCPACRMNMPYFQSVYEDIGNEVQFLMVALVDGIRETIRTAENYIENGGYTFPVFYDTMGDGARGYQVASIPTTIFIDSDGNLAGRLVGRLNEERLREFIDEIK